MATHSNVLAWRVPWTEEPGRLVYRVAQSQTMTAETEHASMHNANCWITESEQNCQYCSSKGRLVAVYASFSAGRS